MKLPPLAEIPPLPSEIEQAATNGELVLFVGAGISRLLNMPSWDELAAKALEELRSKQFINFAAVDQLNELHARTKLSIAYEIAEEAGYSLNLSKFFEGFAEGTGIYKLINDIGCGCVTTNYDEVLAPRYAGAIDGSTTPGFLRRINDREQFFTRYLEPGVVVHLHGSVSLPGTMVVTTKNYLQHYDHENVRYFLGELFETKTVLFLGYGLDENEILEHILRRGRVGITGDRRRFSLHGFRSHQQPLYEQLAQYYRASFGVHLLGYTTDNLNYRQQEKIIETWAPKIRVQNATLTDDYMQISRVLGS